MSNIDKKRGDTISVETDPLDSTHMGASFYLVMTSVIAAISSFNAGLNSAITNIPEDTMRVCQEGAKLSSGLPACMPSSNGAWGAVIAMLALGGGIGSLSGSRILGLLGRRRTLMANNLLFIVGGIIISTSTTLVQMALGRVVMGAGSGLATVAVSTYVGEISPTKARGALGTMLQFMLVVGILVGQIISIPFNSPELWRYLFVLTVIPSVAQFFLLFGCPESPRYLISRNQIEPARAALSKLRKGYNIDNEFNAIVEGQKASNMTNSSPAGNAEEFGMAEEKPISTGQAMAELFKDRVQFKYLITAFILHAAQQLSGINAVIFYSTKIFKNIMPEDTANLATIGVGALNLAVTIVSVFLIDRLGRKILLLSSMVGMTIMSVLLVVGLKIDLPGLVIPAVLLFVGSFAIGLGSIPWLIMPEIFPTRTVAAASALCMALNWMCNFAVSLLFPIINDILEAYTFVVFAAINFSAALFVLAMVPETKGRSIEDILSSARQS